MREGFFISSLEREKRRVWWGLESVDSVCHVMAFCGGIKLGWGAVVGGLVFSALFAGCIFPLKSF